VYGVGAVVRHFQTRMPGWSSPTFRESSMATVTNLAEVRKERLHVLTDMLAHARIFIPADLALDTEWRSKTHSAVEAAASEGGLAAEIRDLLKEVLDDVEIVEDASFKRRADRALAEYDGVVGRGQDIVYEYRWQEADGSWSSWRPIPDTGELDCPNEARKIQHRIAAAPACEAAN
jgi:hypothetical protein